MDSKWVTADLDHTGLGSRRERVTYLNANHGNMCKFRDPSDPNYLSVKNTLGSVVQDLLEDGEANTIPQQAWPIGSDAADFELF